MVIYITLRFRIFEFTAYPNSIRRFFTQNMKNKTVNDKKPLKIHLGEQRISGNTHLLKSLLKDGKYGLSVECQSKQNHVCIFSKKIIKEIISVKVNARTLYAKKHWIFNGSKLVNPDISGAIFTLVGLKLYSEGF